MIVQRKFVVFLLVLSTNISSCRFLEEKQNESDAAIDSTSLTYQILEGKIEPANDEVFKHLLQMKNLLPKPNEIPSNTVDRENNLRAGEKRINDPCYNNPEWKKVYDGCDYTSSVVRNASIQIAANNPGPYNIGQLYDLFDFATKKWSYINDPIRFNYVAKASETIEQNYTGDCDDFAVLMGSMIMSIGGDMRLNYAWNDTAGHAFVEANLGMIDWVATKAYLKQRYGLDRSTAIHYRRDEMTQSIWLNMDWFANYPGGRYYGHDHGIRFFVASAPRCESFTIDSLGRIITYKN